MNMASTRLTFLYPHLFRGPAGRLSEPLSQFTRNSHRRKVISAPPLLSCQHTAQLTTSPTGRQSAFPKRAGTGVEPQQPPPPQDAIPLNPPQSITPESKTSQAVATGVGSQQDAKAGGGKDEASSAQKGSAPGRGSAKGDGPPPESSKNEASSTAPSDPGPSSPSSSPSSATAIPSSVTNPNPKKHSEGPMETILHMGPPEDAEHKPPHLTAPPYVHHFDSYSLVKQLTAGRYTQDQAITAMKAVRGLLSANLDVAQESLVSKSDVENETYLFRAACSELSTEVKNNRRVADEHMRQQRTHLQHEVDILTQRLNQELQTLNDNVRGMFNDRRMAVREEQKGADSAIQQINYKISVELNSDARSDIEGLRWVLIRRSAIGIIFMAVLTLGTLRYASYISHERKEEADKRKRDKENAKRHDGKTDLSPAPAAAEILAAS